MCINANQKFFFTRHGETRQSRASIVQGHSDTHLTARGKSDSLALGDYLARNYHIQTIITSDLSRAVMTAKLIAQKLRTPPLIVETSALRELACGVFEGQPYARLKKMQLGDPEGFEEFAPPGGESLAAMRQRVTDWYRGFMAAADKEALIITHKGPLAVILEIIAPSLPAEFTQAALDHGALVSLEIKNPGAAKLVEVLRPCG